MTETAGKLYRTALQTHWISYTTGTLTLLATSGSEVLVPKFIQWSLDTIATGGIASVPKLFIADTPTATLRHLTQTLAMVMLIGLLGRFGWRQLLARRTHVAGRDLKVRMWDVLKEVSLSVHQRYPLGDLMNRATGDWSASRAIHGFTLVLTLDLIFFAVLSISCMFSINVELTLYCLAIFPLLPHLILRLARLEHKLHTAAQEKLGELSDKVAQSLVTIKIQRATNSGGYWQKALEHHAKRYAEYRFQVIKTGWKIFPLGACPTLVAYTILLFWGGQKITAEELSVGQFVALLSYVFMLQGPLFDMGDCIAEWQRGFASLARIAEVFSLSAPENKKNSVCKVNGNLIEFRNLSLCYTEKGTVLSQISLKVAKGEKIGIYGPIGAGKSTLLKVLASLVEVPRGSYFIDGVDAQDLGNTWFQKNITVVPQRAFLFAGTIRYNLNLDQEFSETKLWHILETVMLKSEIKALPLGLDTPLGEGGVNLSGGQRQRLSLARALLRPEKVFLFDDCLSAVDVTTEGQIVEKLSPLLGDKIVVWVAHRKSTLKLCDRVYELKEGVLSDATDL